MTNRTSAVKTFAISTLETLWGVGTGSVAGALPA
jgi:hypothetical protein